MAVPKTQVLATAKAKNRGFQPKNEAVKDGKESLVKYPFGTLGCKG